MLFCSVCEFHPPLMFASVTFYYGYVYFSCEIREWFWRKVYGLDEKSWVYIMAAFSGIQPRMIDNVCNYLLCQGFSTPIDGK